MDADKLVDYWLLREKATKKNEDGSSKSVAARTLQAAVIALQWKRKRVGAHVNVNTRTLFSSVSLSRAPSCFDRLRCVSVFGKQNTKPGTAAWHRVTESWIRHWWCDRTLTGQHGCNSNCDCHTIELAYECAWLAACHVVACCGMQTPFCPTATTMLLMLCIDWLRQWKHQLTRSLRLLLLFMPLSFLFSSLLRHLHQNYTLLSRFFTFTEIRPI